MSRCFIRQALFGLYSISFIGCGGPAVESAADRIAVKKEDWRRQRASAEERFEEVAARLTPDERRRLHAEFEREFDEGERSLDGARLR